MIKFLIYIETKLTTKKLITYFKIQSNLSLIVEMYTVSID